ncbi:MAG: hypothetical protein WD014_04610 [Dongiaceae bacterium]
MIRTVTLTWLSVATAAAVGLFQVKDDVQVLEEELTRLNQQILRDRAAIHVLRAEWSYLNDPARLTELSRRYLELAPVAAEQITDLDALPERLPPAPAEETPP